MCNEFARRIALEKLIEEFSRTREMPKFEWIAGRIPNDMAAKDSIKIRDPALIVRHRDGALVGEMVRWAWEGPRGAPVFNFRSDGRDFSGSDRVLIPATGFYEYTAPDSPKVKLKDRHLFEMAGEPWFWIAGIVRDDAFTLLTTEPGADVAPYHGRQIVTFHPAEGMAWLTLSAPQADLLKAAPKGALIVKTLRKDGVELAA